MSDEKPFCFVIAPIGERTSLARKQSDTALYYIIEPALADLYQIKRADSDERSGEITQQMFMDIVAADLIVCNLSGLNPNVMYELGVAHTLSKRVIHIFDSKTTLPFDVRQHRAIDFDVEDPESHRIAAERVRRFEKSLRTGARTAEGGGVSNPYTDAIRENAGKDEAEKYPAILEELEELYGRLEGVERSVKIGRSSGARGTSEKDQVDAAARLIDMLADRTGYERVLLDNHDGRRLVVYGDRILDTSGVPGEINGFKVEFRLT